MPLLRRRKADKGRRSGLRRVRRVLTLGTAVAGVLAWRERQLSRNAERLGGPPAT